MIRILHNSKCVPYNGPMRCIRGYSVGTEAERAAEGLINEGLIVTYPIDESGRIISRMFSKYLADFYYEDGQFVVSLDPSSDTEKLENDIIERFDRLGWFCSVKDSSKSMLVFEAKFQTKISPNRLPLDYRCLYHISPTKHKEKILKMGLCPRSNNKMFSFPERIYFLPCSVSDNSLYAFACNLWINGWDQNDDKYTVYVVDTALLDNKSTSNEVKFQVDANCTAVSRDGYNVPSLYTTDNIRPQAIVDYIDLNLNEIKDRLNLDLESVKLSNDFINDLKVSK